MTEGLFSEELQVFQAHRHEWLTAHAGSFVVIRGSEIVADFFDSYADAFRAGLQTFGIERNFLVKQVFQTDPVYFIS